MPLLFIGLGIFLLIAAVRGGDNLKSAATLLRNDFTGKNSFFVWLIALFAIGALGYIKPLRPLSIALMTLVMLAIFLSKGTGFFDQVNKALKLS